MNRVYYDSLVVINRLIIKWTYSYDYAIFSA